MLATDSVMLGDKNVNSGASRIVAPLPSLFPSLLYIILTLPLLLHFTFTLPWSLYFISVCFCKPPHFTFSLPMPLYFTSILSLPSITYDSSPLSFSQSPSKQLFPAWQLSLSPSFSSSAFVKSCGARPRLNRS